MNLQLIEIDTPKGDNWKRTEHANADQYSDEDEKIIPVIVRPGHIRFESSGSNHNASLISFYYPYKILNKALLYFSIQGVEH